VCAPFSALQGKKARKVWMQPMAPSHRLSQHPSIAEARSWHFWGGATCEGCALQAALWKGGFGI